MPITEHQNEPHVFRTRTPADLKWLLNERAAILGEIVRCQQRRAGLLPEITRRQSQLQRCAATLAGIEKRQSEYQVFLESLDRCIGLAYAKGEPGAGGIVKAWAGKYGPRGGLKKYLAQVLADAAPASLDTQALAILAAGHFRITFLTANDRASFGKTLKTTLRYIERDGKIEALHTRQAANSPGIWKWVGDRTPSFAEMALADQEARANDACARATANSDPASHQVASEREGRTYG